MKYAKNWFTFCVLAVLAASCASPQERPLTDEQRAEKVRIIRQVMSESEEWDKVHAATYLLHLDYRDGVYQEFVEEESIHGNTPFYRIGIWRVLALSQEGGRTQWVARIREVATDSTAQDQIHAVESLAKLGETTGLNTTSKDPILNLFITWANGQTSAAEWTLTVDQFLGTLGGEQRDASERERRLAAYAIANTGNVSGEQWNQLSALSLTSNLPNSTKAYAISAAIASAPKDSLKSPLFANLNEELRKIVPSGGDSEIRELILALAENGSSVDLEMLRNLKRSPALDAAAAYASLRIDRRHDESLTNLDWLVILIYGVLMLWIGWYYSRKNKTKEDYLLGGRKMNPIAVGISLFATLLSTLSYLSYPGEMIKHGPAIFAGMLAFPFVYYAAGWWLIPRIMKMNVTSAYEILEYKLGPSVRYLATFMFLSLRFLWMATIIYVTVDVALLSVVPIDRSYIPVIGIILMVITIVYTAMGGLKAVVITDVIQSIIFMGGGVVSVIVVIFGIGSLTGWLPAEWPGYWNPPQIGFDMQERSTVGNAMLMLFVWYICTTGSDQLAIQRYLSTKDVQAARKSLKVSLYSNLFAKILLGLVGLAMLAYFTNNPHLLSDHGSLQDQADTLFPRFIMVGLPSGVSGILIAGLLAAAMSSLSSSLNSVSSVIAQDVLPHFRRRPKEKSQSLRAVKNLSYITGAITMIMSLFIAQVEGNLFDVVAKVVNLFVAPLFVLFFMALFVPFATVRGTLFAGFAAIAAAIGVAYFQLFGITVLWILPVSLIVGIICGVSFSFFHHRISLNRK